ncbi:MAG: NnrS family protein [Azovibrio sp.]
MKVSRFFRSDLPVWGCPFRPFFLLAAAYAALTMAWWLGSLGGMLPLPVLPGGSVIWHAHEMIFGVAFASIAGFLLTAVPEFTGSRPVSRQRLQLLVLFWLAGRIAYLLSGWVGMLPAAVFDLGLLGILLGAVAGPLWRQASHRHLAFFHTLLALAVVHAGFYLALIRNADAMAWLWLACGLLMILIVVALSRISMRMVNDVLEKQGGIVAPYLARPPRRNLVIFTIALFSAAEFMMPGNTVTGWLALAAAAAVFNLLNDWHIGRALLQRWVLIPYLVYWVMALGYATLGIGLLSGHNLNSAGHHLLLAGSLSLSILIVMSILGRIHSGYSLDTRRWLPFGGLLLLLAGLIRSAASWPVFGENYVSLLGLAGVIWLSVWLIYLANSWHVLSGERPDGGTGCDGTTD